MRMRRSGASSLVAMGLLSWKLTILSLALVPLFVFLTYRVGKIRKAVQSIAQQSLADLTAITEETLSVSGILLSKVFGRQRHEIGRFRDENQRLTDIQLRQRMIGRSFFAVVGTFFSITPFLVYLVAGLVGFKGRGQLTPGAIVAFTTLQARLFFPIGQMLSVSTDVQSSMALFERIFAERRMGGDKLGKRNMTLDRVAHQCTDQCMRFAQGLGLLDAMTIGFARPEQIDDTLTLLARHPAAPIANS